MTALRIGSGQKSQTLIQALRELSRKPAKEKGRLPLSPSSWDWNLPQRCVVGLNYLNSTWFLSISLKFDLPGLRWLGPIQILTRASRHHTLSFATQTVAS